MILITMVFAGMFAVKNPEYIDAVQQNKADGMKWTYVGPQSPSAHEPHISALSPNGNEIILFKMEK
jgi:hypothetical protein|tara:strand:+ start:298 stop:495 length:198 start_codon:yes stop_codon:yes gene_type:complete